MDSLFQDIRFAFRQFLRAPAFTIAALFALALGTGANAAIFSVVYPVLWRPLPFPDANELVALVPYRQETGEESAVSYPELLDWREQTASFDGVAAFTQESVSLGAPDEPLGVWGLFATGNLTEVFGVEPLVGRGFGPQDEEAGANVALLGESMWRQNFEADPGVVGRSVPINGKTFTIVGVLPDFRFPGLGRAPGLWAPLQAAAHPEFLEDRGHHHLTAIGRLKDGVSAKSAGLEVGAMASHLEELHPGASSLKLVALDAWASRELRTAAWLLLGAVGMVLFIACANVANLLLARASFRQREFAIRLSLGASRLRIVRQLLTESVLLSLLGSLLGLLLSVWVIDLLRSLVGRRLEVVSMNLPMLGFTLGCGLLTGLVFGLLPALTGSRVGIHEALKEAGSRRSGSPRRAVLQKVLIAWQIALAFVLLTGARLMVTSLINVTEIRPGFEPKGLVSVGLPLPDWSYSPEQKRAFYREVIHRLERLPAVTSVSGGDPLPFHGGRSRTSVTAVGAEPRSPGDPLMPNMYEVVPQYFSTLGIPLIEGRDFTEVERDPAHSRSIIINQKLASYLWPGQSALGQRIAVGGHGEDPLEVVGVVGDVRHQSLEAEPPLQIYLPFEHSPWMRLTLLVKVDSDPEAIFPALRKVIRELDPNLPAVAPQVFGARVTESRMSRRITMFLFGAFAILALILASVGLYGLTSYTTEQRTHELGIRLALGAQPREVVLMILGEGLVLVTVGLAFGVALALALSRVMEGLVYGVPPADPRIFAGAALVLGAAALAATVGPARRATKVDPLVVLRSE